VLGSLLRVWLKALGSILPHLLWEVGEGRGKLKTREV